MAKKRMPTTPHEGDVSRKRRTREHVIADLSVHHVEGLALRCGYTVQRVSADYGVDLWLVTFDERGEIEDDHVRLQLKASDRLVQYQMTEEESYSFPVSTKDYRLWSRGVLPVFLILYDARMGEAYWLDIKEYHRTHQPALLGNTVRVRVPRHHVLGVQTLQLMRLRKRRRITAISTRLGE